jgi:hypothetical protein
MASVVCLQFTLQPEDTLEHTNLLCHVEFSQLVEHCVT